MRAAIAVETGTGWNMDRGLGLRRWVFPAPASRARVKTFSGNVHN